MQSNANLTGGLPLSDQYVKESLPKALIKAVSRERIVLAHKQQEQVEIKVVLIEMEHLQARFVTLDDAFVIAFWEV